MKTATFVFLASTAGLASAQASYNSTTGKFTCAQPGVAYCAGESLQTDIIIRCDDSGVGQPGRCSDNLDGEPPVGDYPALCWQTTNTTGDAACEKNCVVYGSSGNYDGTFTLPADECTPTYTASSSSGATSATATATDTSTTEYTLVTRTSCTSVPTLAATGGSSGGNVTVTGTGSGYGSTAATSATLTASGSKTPVGPTSTSSTSAVATAGAAINAGSMLAGVGLVAAYFL